MPAQQHVLASCTEVNHSGVGDPYVTPNVRRSALDAALKNAEAASSKDHRWAGLAKDVSAIFAYEQQVRFAPEPLYSAPGYDNQLPGYCASAGQAP